MLVIPGRAASPGSLRPEAVGGTRREPAGGACWPLSTALLLTYAASGAITAGAVLAGATHHPSAGLLAYAVMAAVISVRSPLIGVLPIAAIAWLFDNGFLINRHAFLSWHSPADGWRLAVLIAAALSGGVLGALARARARPTVPKPGVH